MFYGTNKRLIYHGFKWGKIMKLYNGVVENRKDPLKLGRCQVRVVGLHTHDKVQLPTEELPWAYPLQPVTSAAMNGIGHAPVGPVEGTWVAILFTDDDEQFPVMLGTLGGIPQPATSPDVDLPGIILKDEYGNESNASEIVTSGSSDQPIRTNEQNEVPQSESQSADITTEPPPEFTTLRSKRKLAIEALLEACDKVGLTTREQKCAVLAIAGGESGFIPDYEGYNYSVEGLLSTFSTTFKKNHPDKVNEYARCTKTKTREEFFNFVYDPSNNGKQLGNTQQGDGGKYYGRGLTGITGRTNYTKYGNMIGVDLLSSPDLLVTDLSVSALASATMIKDNTNKKFPKIQSSDHPGYFYAAKKAQGNDTGDGAERRLRYYEYFYGAKAAVGPVDKSAAPQTATESDPISNSGNSTTPAPSSTAPGPVGFRDPNNKYPLKDHIKEADTNRLARGQITGTVVNIKDSNRKESIPIANGLGTFSEPRSSYAAKYPYNHVFETESGHIQEFDDTPGHERIHMYHRKGTFFEIDPNGTRVTHIVGDDYHIVDRNGCIYIEGECNITIGGKANILCQNDADIQIAGDTDMIVGGDFKLGVAGDMTTVVGGAYTVQSGANLTMQSNSSMHLLSVGTMNSYSGGTMNVKSSGYYALDAVRIDIADGLAIGATSVNLTPPVAGAISTNSFDYLQAPPSEGEDDMLIETEEEWNSPAGQAKAIENEKKYGSEVPAQQDSSTESTGGKDTSVIASCQIIYSTEEFTNDFRLSPNFTLGMLIDGGVNGKNRLRDQNGLTKQQIVCNLAQLCQNIYEPLLNVLPGGIGGYNKQWKINSGYRISSNIPSGGVSKSDHMIGRATDLTLLPYDATKAQRNYDFAVEIEKILPYDQIIMEYMPNGSNWIHIGYRGTKEGDTAGGGVNRKMAFTMYNGKTIKKDGKTGFFLL